MYDFNDVVKIIAGYLYLDQNEDFLSGFDFDMKEEFIELFYQYLPKMIQKSKEEKIVSKITNMYDRNKSKISLSKEEFGEMFKNQFPQMFQEFQQEEEEKELNLRTLYDCYKSEISLRISMKKTIKQSIVEFSKKHPKMFQKYRMAMSKNLFGFKERIIKTLRICFQDEESVLSEEWSKETIESVIKSIMAEIS